MTTKLTRCVVTVAKLENFKGIFAGGHTPPIYKTDAKGELVLDNGEPVVIGHKPYVSGRFFPNGKTVCDLDEGSIASIRHDEELQARISIVVSGDDDVAITDAPPAPPADDKAPPADQNPGKPLKKSEAK